MERFIIGAALFAAGLFALGAVLGPMPGASFHFSFSDESVSNEPSTGTGGTRATAAAQTFAAQKLKFEDGLAVVRIVPEDRADFAVSLASAGTLAAPLLRQVDDTLVIDGDAGGKIRRCRNDGFILGDRTLSRADAPVLVVQAPRAVVAAIGSAGIVEVGASQSLDLTLSGCADSTAGDVAGALKITRSGSADLTAGAAASAAVDSSGAGEIRLGAIANGLEARISGSGSLTAASLQGDLTASIAGSGDVEIEGGALATAKTEIAGSGDIEIKAPVNRLEVRTMGSGGVDVQGVVGDLDVAITGSGDVSVEAVTGAVSQRVMGSGSVTINKR